MREANDDKQLEKDGMSAPPSKINDLAPDLELSKEELDNIAGGRATSKPASTSDPKGDGGVDFD